MLAGVDGLLAYVDGYQGQLGGTEPQLVQSGLGPHM